MDRKKTTEPEQVPKKGKIRANVIDEVNGIQHLKDVHAVRICSKGYVLLVLEDFAPTLGQVEGDVTFLCDDKEVGLENIRGFYKHQRNEFTLLIQEDLDGWYEKI